MVRDAAATKARILYAAVAEFARFGIAGGRIDRIADTAHVDKKLIYNYFTDKETLFDSALHATLVALTTAVPVDEKDLPGYVGRLFDYVTAHPEAHRLSMWRQLERPAAGPNDAHFFEEKVSVMQAGSPDSHLEPLPPVDLLVIVQAMAGGWGLTPLPLLTADGSNPQSDERISIHRAALVTAVTRIITPTRNDPA